MSLCWWCCHDIGNARIGVPTMHIKYIKKKSPSFMIPCKRELPIEKDVDKYNLEGQFCTFECARSYIINKKDYQCDNKLQMLNYIRKKTLNDRKAPPLKSAPTWKLLKQFGGTLTYDEFRSDIHEWIIEDPGFTFSTPSIIKRRKHVKDKSSWKDKQELINNSSKSSEQLKIKRSKPRTNTTGFGDISSTLGIKIIVKE